MTIAYLFVVWLARVLNYAILARIIISWLPISRESRLVQILYEVTEPILGPLRRVIPPVAGLDLTPLVGLIVIQVGERVLLTLLSRL